MLYFKFLTFRFFRFSQNNFYIDFFLKKLIEIFVKNFFIFSAHYFGEKYIIEFLTKKIIDSYLFNINRFVGFFELFFSYFFIQIVFFFFFF